MRVLLRDSALASCLFACGLAHGDGLPLADERLTLLPESVSYPHYLADPHRRAMAVKWLGFDHVDIPDSGASRLQVRAGLRLGLLRLPGEGPPEARWQLLFEGGYDAQFDNQWRQDNIGWDGHYGLLLITARGPWAFKLGALHVSGHLGDEYMERTGRARINYTREELVAGLAWSPNPRWTGYAETGRAYQRGSPGQERWRAQAGVQWEAPRRNRREQGWYAGLDLQALEERDWRVDIAVQAGMTLHGAQRSWRLGVELYDGRPPMAEFYAFTERYVALGAWLDF